MIDRSLSRRQFLLGAAGAASALALPEGVTAEGNYKTFNLSAVESRSRLVPEPYGDTAVWCYNHSVPGPEIRVKQGDRLVIKVDNQLTQPTTVHWHGVRTPNAMDGVPFLTQAPINQGDSFSYEFDAQDAGTFWYHPHMQSVEQLARGLYGPLIVEERNPIRVDRDVTWVLDDWRLRKSAEIDDEFSNWHDMTHAGRYGNTVTINGRITETFDVRPGERIRLRLINAANARIFGLDFAAHRPWVIAVDGQPVAPFEISEGELVTIGPAMRVDLVIDMDAGPGLGSTIADRFNPRRKYDLVDLVYGGEPVRASRPDWPIELEPNPLSIPQLENAERHEVVFTGGAMGHGVVSRMGIQLTERMRKSMDAMRNGTHNGRFWFINGEAMTGHMADPMLVLKRDRTYLISMVNATAWFHPIHLHGHSFQLVSRNGVPLESTRWHDTVLMAPQEEVEIALVADNPGDWMFHCHILEHMAAGMMGVIRVS